MNIVSKIESNIKQLAIDKFLSIDPKTYPSSVYSGMVSVDIELVKDKSCLTVSLFKGSSTFEISTFRPGAFSSTKTCAFKFSKYYTFLSSKQTKKIKEKADEFFQYKYREILNDNLDIKSSRKLKLKEIL